ncbi:CPBP family intramembrane metalloprotease [Limosilactobacillus fermentum]
MSILWLNVLLIFTTFPGIIYVLFNAISIFRYLKMSTIYLGTLIVLVFFDCCVLDKKILILVLVILLLPLGYASFEKKLLNLNRNILLKNMNYFRLIVMFPLFEELNFRYFLYLETKMLSISVIAFIILSTLSFFLTHLLYQGISAYIKLLFSFGQAVLLVLSNSIILVILVHIIFNILVFLDRLSVKREW